MPPNRPSGFHISDILQLDDAKPTSDEPNDITGNYMHDNLLFAFVLFGNFFVRKIWWRAFELTNIWTSGRKTWFFLIRELNTSKV